MQYSININQLVLADTTLDMLDAAILQYIILICLSVAPSIEKGRKNGHTWLNYSHLMNEMPLLRIKTSHSIGPRIHKIEENGFITTQKIGKRLYVKLTDKIDTLFSDKKQSSIVQTIDIDRTNDRSSIVQTIESLEYNNPNTIIPAKPDSGIIEDSGRDIEIVRAKKITEIIDAFRKVNPMIKFQNKTERSASEELLDKFGDEKAVELALFAVSVQGQDFAPTITTPFELVKKIGKLRVFYERNNNKKAKGMIGNMDEAMAHFANKSVKTT